MSRARIAVLGLGNLMRTDDALGMLAIEALRMDPRLPASVAVIDGGTLGLDLLHPLDGVTHLLALDAIEAGAAPGALLRFAGRAIDDLPISKSVHLLGFSDLIGAMRLTSGAPREIVVLGVQPQTIGWGTELTPAVQAALPALLDAACAQLAEWSRELAGPHSAGLEFSAAAEFEPACGDVAWTA
ncbi:MAG TPA: hydrogenase maturation protease [Terracidiphilus sp.]|nr:hydrogenase maturation protease [Terracidiphilus sp.]